MKATRSVGAVALAMGVVMAFAAPASAAVLSDFGNFAFTGTYETFYSGTFTSGPNDFRIQAYDFGGGWYNLPAAVDASGATALQIDLDVNAGNVADKFYIVLIDADGTERVFPFTGVGVGAGQSLSVDLADYFQDNAVGAVAGLDVSAITVFHIQGTFANGNPGLALDMTVDNLSLVPEPASIALLGLSGVAIAIRRGKRVGPDVEG